MGRRPGTVVAHVAIIAAATALTSCSSDDTPGPGPAAVPTPSTTARTSTPAPPPASAPAPTPAPGTAPERSPDRRAADLCAANDTRVEGRLADERLDEASGLVVSRRHPGVLWSHNDGNETPGLFGVGPDGAELGFHPLQIDGVVDVEDIAIRSGSDDDQILLADIGDNREERPTVRLYRFPEPDPAAPGPLADVDVLEFVYPDRPHNAEVLLVDDESNTIVIVTKEQERTDGLPRDLGRTEPSSVFEGPLDGHGGEPVELRAVGGVDAPELETRTIAASLHPTTIIGNGGVPTGGDVTGDGALVALRTYETAWVWPREPGQRVAEVFATDPCQVVVATEVQGEALGFDGDDLVTVSEGARAPINRMVP